MFIPLVVMSSTIPLQQFDPQELKAWIKAEALALGFADCVIAKPTRQDKEMPRFLEYLERGYHGDMHYLNDNLDKRADPTLLGLVRKALFVYA
jgi:epoxyqueuosine reductase